MRTCLGDPRQDTGSWSSRRYVQQARQTTGTSWFTKKIIGCWTPWTPLTPKKFSCMRTSMSKPTHSSLIALIKPHRNSPVPTSPEPNKAGCIPPKPKPRLPRRSEFDTSNGGLEPWRWRGQQVPFGEVVAKKGRYMRRRVSNKNYEDIPGELVPTPGVDRVGGLDWPTGS